MKVHELERFQLNALKESFVCETIPRPHWRALADAYEIPDSIIFDYYADIEFVNDDFFAQ